MKYLAILSICLLQATLAGHAQAAHAGGECPVGRYIEPMSPGAFAERFSGDTISFYVPEAGEAMFESFRLAVPDTVWLKKRPKKHPEEMKHYELIRNYKPVNGEGVNAYRQYTPGIFLEKARFILRGMYSETIPYLGHFDYVILEDAADGKRVKWQYTQSENEGFIILSPSILRHLSLMKGHEFGIETSDSTSVAGKCTDVAYSIEVKPDKLIPSVDATFATPEGIIKSHNWQPRYFLKKE